MAARKWCGDWCVGGGCGGLRLVPAHQFILSKIDVLRSAASSTRSDAVAEKGHVNYDVSEVPVLTRADPTTGRGCYGWVMAAQQRVIEYSFVKHVRAL
jgi:hypothetical protein